MEQELNLQAQFVVKNDILNKRFCFNSINNKSNSYTVSYHECDSDINNAWIAVWKAIKLKHG